MATPTNSRKLECHGPCDEYGDDMPEGVARVGVFYGASDARHHIVLDFAEACMLVNELRKAIDVIKKNRHTRFGGVLSR